MSTNLNLKKYKSTPKTIKIILDAIKDGLTQRDAALLAGISEDTLSLWKRDNSDFSEQIRQKQIEFKRKNVKLIQKEAERNWKASAWLLERKFPEEYSGKISVDVSSDEKLNEIGETLKAILSPRKVA